MRPGKLDQRITLQGRTETADGGGGTETAWADLPSVPDVWAHVEAMSGTERLDDGSFAATGSYLFTIRNRTDVSERDRIVWRGEFFNIDNVARLGGRVMYLQITAKRGAPQ